MEEIIQPVIEKEDIDNPEEPKIEEWKGDKLELERIKVSPYKYIRDFYEVLFPKIGSRVFSILSFLPVSLIMPKIIINGRMIRIHTNLLWLSPSGYAKSQIAREFAKITFNPLLTKEMTTPRLEKELTKNNMTSLIVEDVSVWFMDEEKIKFLEGFTGEEESLSRETMRNIKKGTNRHVDVVAFCSGTSENITNQKVKTGILRRFTPLVIYLSPEEHAKIITHINSSVGLIQENRSSEPIRRFYEELLEIQKGYNKEIKPIEGYIISEEIKKEANDFFLPLTVNLHKRYRISLATENENFWRMICCHAFLNLRNKHKLGLIQDNKIIIDKNDLEVGKNLIAREISTKTIILQCIENIDYYNIRTREQLIEWEERRRKTGKVTPNEARFILQENMRK